MKKFSRYILSFLAVFILIPVTVVFSVSASGIDKRLEITPLTQSNIELLDKDSGDYDGESAAFMIDVYFAEEDETRSISLEEYTAGVVLGEMSLSFEFEALKAQAVASRTYAVYKLQNGGCEDSYHKNNAAVCTDYTHCQAWQSPASIYEDYPLAQAEEYAAKLKEVIESTKGIVMTYEGNIVQAYYFSNGGGYTENIEDVWDGEAIEYLKGVSSVGDIKSESYCTIESFSPAEFIAGLQKIVPELKVSEDEVYDSICNFERSETGRVKSVSIGGYTFKGTQLRTALGLRSTNFILSQLSGGEIVAVVFGSGHGVGMSQWGAGVMAASGSSYEENLKHYYSGVDVVQYDFDAVM